MIAIGVQFVGLNSNSARVDCNVERFDLRGEAFDEFGQPRVLFDVTVGPIHRRLFGVDACGRRRFVDVDRRAHDDRTDVERPDMFAYRPFAYRPNVFSVRDGRETKGCVFVGPCEVHLARQVDWRVPETGIGRRFADQAVGDPGPTGALGSRWFAARRHGGEFRGEAGGQFHVDALERLATVRPGDRQREGRVLARFGVRGARLEARREGQFFAGLRARGPVRPRGDREAFRVGGLWKRFPFLFRPSFERCHSRVGAAASRSRLGRYFGAGFGNVEQVQLQVFERDLRRVLERRHQLAVRLDFDFTRELDEHFRFFFFGNHVQDQLRRKRIGVLAGQI